MHKKSMILGVAGVGKTHTQALLLGEEVPSKRVSTHCVETPIQTMRLRRFTNDIESTSYSRVSANDFSKKMMKSGMDILGHESGYFDKIKFTIKKNVVRAFWNILGFKKWNELNIEKSLLHKLPHINSVKSFVDEVVGEMCDSGGQPQFLEILPRFLKGLAIVILVINLSERLDEYPTSYLYGKDGKSVGMGEHSKLTNEQMLRQFLQIVISQSQKNRQIKFLFVGTHRDLEHDCSETREEKERKLFEMVESFNMQDNAIYADLKKKRLIFAINAKEPDAEDHKVGQKIMEKVMDKDGAETISIPFKYHILELALMLLANTGQRIAFTVNEILQSLDNKYFTEESLKEGLKYLEESRHIFYFSDLFPDKVIGEPQAVLNVLTEIVKHHIKLTSSNHDEERALDGMWMKFKEQGVFTEAILQQISDIFNSDFTAKDMLMLLEKLLVVFQRNSEEYLMPCLLSTKASPPVFESKILKVTFPAMLHFPHGGVRIGTFCSTVCKLISSEKWQHYRHSTVARNCFSLCHPHRLGVVTLYHSFDSFFQVTLHFPPDRVLPGLCVAVLDTVMRVINEVSMELCYEDNDCPVLAFECEGEHVPDMSLHAAVYMKDGDYLLCTRDTMVHQELTDQQRLWHGMCVCVCEYLIDDAVNIFGPI